jgi:hypothetical protein
MNIYFTPDFINDLRYAGDKGFARLALNHVFNDNGEFKSDPDDHRYHGVKDAWIRYVSRGRTAYRIIYIKHDNSIYLYRAGDHSIEDRLAKPKKLDNTIQVKEVKVEHDHFYDYGDLLKNSQPLLLREVITSMYHVGHREILLVSPVISSSIFSPQHHFGRFLDKSIEEGTAVGLVTLPPKWESLKWYGELETREILVYFYENLHAKLYLFDVDDSTQNQFNRDKISKTAILGSSNLTEPGFALDGKIGNEELCYRLPVCKFEEARIYVNWLIDNSIDYLSFKNQS